MVPSGLPSPQGLYDPRNEHDACGVALVATLTRTPTHHIVEQALAALRNLEHRGATGSESDTGDGAGLMIQIPDVFLRDVVPFALPPAGAYAVGTGLSPGRRRGAAVAAEAMHRIAGEEGLRVLGWRDVPIAADLVGAGSRAVMPQFRQVFLSASDGDEVRGIDLDRRAFCLRKRVEREVDVYFPSLSSRTLVYKGMLTAPQLRSFFPDLEDARFASALALVHFTLLDEHLPVVAVGAPVPVHAHNGEINTVKGNRNWMRARESQLRSDLILATSNGCSRSARRAGATPPPSTRCLSCCTWAAGRCRMPC